MKLFWWFFSYITLIFLKNMIFKKYYYIISLISLIYIKHIERYFLIYIIRKMINNNFNEIKNKKNKIDFENNKNNNTMSAIAEIKENININNMAINKLEASNKELFQKLKRYERIENYDYDKLDNLDNKLKDILNIQKNYNKLVSDRHKPITIKYLPFNYDINDIIRKKIVEDSVNKRERDSLTCYYELRDLMFQENILHIISYLLNELYNETYGNVNVLFLIGATQHRLDEVYETQLKADELPDPNYRYKYFEDYTVGRRIKLYIKKHLDIVDKYAKRTEKYETLINRIKYDLLENVSVSNNKVKGFNYGGDTIKIKTTNDKKNGRGYNKLKKIIYDMFNFHCPLIVEDLNENNIKTEWSNECEWFGKGVKVEDYYFRRIEIRDIIYKLI